MAKINTILLTCLQIISLALALVFFSAHAKIIDDQHSNLKVVKVAVHKPFDNLYTYLYTSMTPLKII